MIRLTSSVPAVSGPADSPADAPPGLLALVARRLTNLLKRHRLTRIEDLDDHLLDDIGLTRADLFSVRALTLDQDPLAALDQIARERRAARFEGRRSPLSRVRT